MIWLLLGALVINAAPERYEERAQKIAELKVGRIGCRPLDMLVNERAFNLFEQQSKEAAANQGINEGSAVSIAYAAEQSEKKRVEEGGGDLTKVGDSAAAMAKYQGYWRARCDGWKRDTFMSQFYTNRVEHDRALAANGPPPRPSGNMCYKDYCPCQGKQSPFDMMLCDRLEEGIGVGIDDMIIGRMLRATDKEMERLSSSARQY